MNLIIVLFFIILGIVIFKFIKSAAKSLIYLVIIIVMISAGIMYLDMKESENLKESLQNASMLVFMAEEGSLQYGFLMEKGSVEKYSELRNLDIYQAAYGKKDYRSMLGDQGRLLVYNDYKIELPQNVTYPNSRSGKLATYTAYTIESKPAGLLEAYEKGYLDIYPESLGLRLLRFIK